MFHNRKNKVSLSIDPNRCNECWDCVGRCRHKVLIRSCRDDGGSIALARNPGQCSACGGCQRICPEKAISLTIY